MTNLVSALAYALARAALPTDVETSRDYARRLAPLMVESGFLTDEFELDPTSLDDAVAAIPLDVTHDLTTGLPFEYPDVGYAEYRQGLDPKAGYKRS